MWILMEGMMNRIRFGISLGPLIEPEKHEKLAKSRINLLEDKLLRERMGRYLRDFVVKIIAALGERLNGCKLLVNYEGTRKNNMACNSIRLYY